MTATTARTVSSAPVRHRIRVAGVVQGVGFRPFVHRLATQLGLTGHVGNDSAGVMVEVEGEARAVAEFGTRLVAEAPPLARVFSVDTTPVVTRGGQGFQIVESRATGVVGTFVSPDIAVCDDCLAELFDPADRRARYPFINCTNCGPRFTITLRLPYDRPNTTMRDFALCDACRAEYEDPANRRFHAQPLACADCGPRLWFDGPSGAVAGPAGPIDDTAGAIDDTAGAVHGSDAAIAATQRALAYGAIVAIKGLGGYHLACDATSTGAVDRLRQRKARRDKPLAVMVNDLATARLLAHIDRFEAARLSGPERPIVLLVRRAGGPLAATVAPHNPHVGLLLPYTPLHHLLFRRVPGSDETVPTALVMTSGNLSDEPICYDDADARARLGRIADAWLVHDRPIHVPCDDSVVRLDDGVELPIRRARGYAPLPIRLPFEVDPTLAMGGEIKNTFCLASGHHAWLSQHIGDMGSLETLAAFARATRQFGDMYEVEPQRVAADAHPGYHTRAWADDHAPGAVFLAQHHHAHIAAVMVEHAVPPGERVLGFAFDGTGYGSDDAIWGGEVLVAGYEGFERSAHLRYVPLPGGDATIRKPSRAALAHLWAAGIEWGADLPPVRHTTAEELTVLRRQLERNVQCVPTSSMGRLFDAVSSLLGVRHRASYEAQAAVELEHLAEHGMASDGDSPNPEGAGRDRPAGVGLYRFASSGGEIDAAPVLRAMVDDMRRGCAPGPIAAGFHLAVAELIADTACRLREVTGIERVALSGGVFQNVLLLRLTRGALAARQLQVLTHRLVPPNDGGLALGQVAVAGWVREGPTARIGA